MRRFRAAAIQPEYGELMTPDRVDAALQQLGRAELVVLPEMSHVPYFPLEPDSKDACLAVSLGSDLVASFQQVAARHRCHLLIPIYLRDGGCRANAAVLAGPGGDLLTGRTSRDGHDLLYRKVHMCDVRLEDSGFHESAYFSPGDEYVVWDTDLGVIGVLICYDRHFPEAWRTLRAMGTDVVCVPTTSPMRVVPTFVPEMQAMALQQGVYIVMANRVGPQVLRTSGTTTEFLGSSCIVTPLGHVLEAAPMGRESPGVIGELLPEALSEARYQMGFEGHRRPDTYRYEATRGRIQ